LRQTDVDLVERRVPALGQVKVAERGLIWALVNEPDKVLEALAGLDPDDLHGLATAGILRQAQSLQGWSRGTIPGALFERLSKGEAALVHDIGAQLRAPADPADCIRTLKKQRYERERAQIQRDIDRLQEQEAGRYSDQLDELLRKKEALQRIGHTEGLAH